MDEFSYRATGSFLSKQLQERADKKCRPYTCEQKPANPLRLKSNFPSNLKLIWAVQSATQKYRFAISENQNYKFCRLAPTRGAYRHRHDTLGAGCDGRGGLKANGSAAYGEVVWSWRRDAGVKSAEVFRQ